MQDGKCFSQQLRLKKADEFSSVFLFRKAKFGNYFKIHYQPNGLTNPRLGLVVSKKIHKRANKRNYMKRSIRELFRNSCYQWLNYDIVVRVLKAYQPCDYANVYEEFNYLTKILRNQGN